MPLVYENPPSGSLRQGEIIHDVYEHRISSPTAVSDQDALVADTVHHPLLMVMSPWCDLHQDYSLRQSGEGVGHSNVLQYALLCDLCERGNIRDQFKNSRLWKRAEENRDPRYHHISSAKRADGDEFPDLYMDFKRFVALPLEGLYKAIESGEVKRLILVPDLYREQIMHRFYCFMSRVSLPD